MHPRVHARVEWAVAKAQSAVLLKRLRDFDPNQPRDEHGRWTDGGGGVTPYSPSEPMKEHQFLVSENPTPEKLDQWDKQLSERSAELAKEGKAGNEEDSQIGAMQTALNSYRQEPESELKKEKAGISVVYGVDDTKLLGAAFTFVAEGNAFARIKDFGALNHDAGVKTLEMVARKFGDKVMRIEGTAWAHDGATQAMFAAAGFKVKEGSTGPQVTFVKDDIPGAILLSPVHAAAIFGASQASARLLGYDPNLVTINMGEYPFSVGVVGGYTAAGLAHLDTGKIEIFPRQIPSSDGAVSVTAHEIAHQKYQTVVNAVAKEREAVMADPDTKEGMRADGTLKPPLDEKYPLYSRFVKYEGDVFHKLIDDDGATPYSTAYWIAAKQQQTTLLLATHETIAEMARLQVENNGKLRGTPVWRRYYRDIMKTYDELKAKK